MGEDVENMDIDLNLKKGMSIYVNNIWVSLFLEYRLKGEYYE